MKVAVLLLFFAMFSVVHAHSLERVWKDQNGREVKAKLLEVKGDSVILLLSSGREVPYPLAKLSKEDRAFIADAKLSKPSSDGAKGDGSADNFEAAWPDRVSYEGEPEIVTVEENAAKKHFVYESKHFRYTCDVRLSSSVVKGFAVMFEATHQFVRELPLGLNGGVKKDGKYAISLFENYADYISAGGLPNSSGVFMGGENHILVPLTSLGVKKVGSGYMLDRDESSKTLPHEIVHQLTPNAYFAPGARGWFSEGIAEYVALTPYRSGSFNLKLNARAITEYVTAYGKDNNGGRALGEQIRLGSLKRYMTLPYSDFTDDGRINYGCAVLITNYFFHLDRKEDGARIKKFLKTLKEGKKGEAALEVLLDGQSWEELEADIAKAYSSKGIKFIF
jgi:hypothetical protein